MRHGGICTALATAIGLGAGLAPGTVSAHPHVFIDTGLELVFDDDGALAAVQVVWVYDEFYSLMAVADYGMDPTFSGALDADERAELAAIYSGWVDGFEGDLFIRHAGRPVALSGPLDTIADLAEGRIVVAFRRALDPRVVPDAEEPLVISVHDPSYYTAYTIAVAPLIRGRSDCRADVILPDFAWASEQLGAALAEMLAEGADDFDIEADFPAVGADFAEEVHVTCGP